RTRTGPAAGRKPEPGRGRTRFDRSRSAAVQHGAGPGFDRRAGVGAGNQQALRLPAAFGQRREPQDLRLAARAVRARRAEQGGLSGEACGSGHGRDACDPRPGHHRMILAFQALLALAYTVLAHLSNALDRPVLGAVALALLAVMLLLAP